MYFNLILMKMIFKENKLYLYTNVECNLTALRIGDLLIEPFFVHPIFMFRYQVMSKE